MWGEGKLVTSHVGKEFKSLRRWRGDAELPPHSKVSGSNSRGVQAGLRIPLMPEWVCSLNMSLGELCTV